MKTVFMISEDNHGILDTVCASRKAALVWLIETQWIDEMSDIYCKGNDCSFPLISQLGENWRETLLASADNEEQFDEYMENMGFQVFEADFVEKEKLE